MKKDDFQIQIDAITARLTTETLSADEFENLCRDQNILRIKRKIHSPRFLTPQERRANIPNLSYPKSLNLN